jgi:DNA polymerase III delta subunit
MKNNLNFFLQLYDNLFLQYTEITEFIQIIAGQLLNLKFIAICQQQKKNYVETISDCKLSPFQYSQYTNLLKFTSLAKITKLLDDLSELDYNIKIGNIDGYHELKILLIS